MSGKKQQSQTKGNAKSQGQNNKSKKANNKRRYRRRGPRMSGFQFASRFNLRAIAPVTKRIKEGSIKVYGRDLVTSTSMLTEIPESLTGFFQLIPVNPSYWTGTRVAAIAKGYQYYKPMKFKVYYVPQVPVTTAGVITLGTIWQTDSREGAIEQTLVTSNGGVLTQVYCAAESVVNVRKDAPQKNFQLIGSATEQGCNPFWWCAYLGGAQESAISPPGFVFVDWEYIFSNPQGDIGVQAQVVSAPDAPAALERYRITHPDANFHANSGLISGIALGLLKTLAVPILDKVSVFLLDKAQSLVGKLQYGLGRALNWAHENRTDQMRSNDDTTIVIDPTTGEQDLLPDSTPVVAFMSGRVAGEATQPITSGYIEALGPVDTTVEVEMTCVDVNSTTHVFYGTVNPSMTWAKLVDGVVAESDLTTDLHGHGGAADIVRVRIRTDLKLVNDVHAAQYMVAFDWSGSSTSGVAMTNVTYKTSVEINSTTGHKYSFTNVMRSPTYTSSDPEFRAYVLEEEHASFYFIDENTIIRNDAQLEANNVYVLRSRLPYSRFNHTSLADVARRQALVLSLIHI